MRHVHDVGGRMNNRAENSHLLIRRRERKQQKFRLIRFAQKQLSSRTLKQFRHQAQAEWNIVTKVVMG